MVNVWRSGRKVNCEPENLARKARKRKRETTMVVDKYGSGLVGSMVIQEDGSIISSSGELSSSEVTSQQMIQLMSHSLAVSSLDEDADRTNGSGDNPNGRGSNHNGSLDNAQNWNWNRLTVNFGAQSYMACLSNRKIHIVKKQN